MNSLSILLYAADVSGNVSFVLIATILTVGVGLFATLALYAAENDAVFPYWRPWAMLLAVCAIISIFVPGRTTILMIAASEAGEAAITSPDGKALIDELKGRIMRELTSDKENGK